MASNEIEKLDYLDIKELIERIDKVQVVLKKMIPFEKELHDLGFKTEFNLIDIENKNSKTF